MLQETQALEKELGMTPKPAHSHHPSKPAHSQLPLLPSPGPASSSPEQWMRSRLGCVSRAPQENLTQTRREKAELEADVVWQSNCKCRATTRENLPCRPVLLPRL